MVNYSAYLSQFTNQITGITTNTIIEEIPAPRIEYLVFEGAGVRGSAYGGVIQELERAQIISSIKHVAGSSVGSIAALLIALGYTAEEINQKLDKIYFSHYL